MSWIYSFVWAVLPFLTRNRYALEGFLTSCSFDFISRNYSNRIVIISMFIGGFFIPLIIISSFYISIVTILRKNEIYLTYQIRNTNMRNCKKIYLNGSNHNDESSFIQHSSLNKNLFKTSVRSQSENLIKKKPRNKSSINSKREMKLVKMVSLIVLMYLVAWTPYAVVTLAAQLGSNINYYVNPYTTSLPALFAKASSVYNPLIYTLSNKEFCQFFFKYLRNKE